MPKNLIAELQACFNFIIAKKFSGLSVPCYTLTSVSGFQLLHTRTRWHTLCYQLFQILDLFYGSSWWVFNVSLWWGSGEIEILVHCLREDKAVQPLWTTVREFLTVRELPCDPAVSPLGVSQGPEGWLVTPASTAALFPVAERGKQASVRGMCGWAN